MPDVFELQASVKIDTSEANQKLDELIAKAKQLDGDLSKDHKTGSPSTGNNGTNGNSPTNQPDYKESPRIDMGDVVDTAEDTGKVIFGTRILDMVSLFIPEIMATAAFAAGGIYSGVYLHNRDQETMAQLGSFDFTPEQQSAAMNWYENQFNSAASTKDEGFTMADTAYWDFEEAVGEEMAKSFTHAMDLWGFTNKDFSRQDIVNQTGYDITDLFKDTDPSLVPVKPEVEDGAAEDIASQIGNVVVPATVQVTGVSGGGFFDTVKSVGTNILGDAAGAVAGGLLGSLLSNRKKSVGMERIPTDNYVVALHQDESVLTKEEAAQWRKRTGNQEASSFDIANALRGVNVYLGADQVGHLISGPVGANINSRQNYKLRSMGG